MYLQKKAPTELNALERKLLEQIKKQSIDYFPLNKALSLPQSEQDEEITDKVNDDHMWIERVVIIVLCRSISSKRR